MTKWLVTLGIGAVLIFLGLNICGPTGTALDGFIVLGPEIASIDKAEADIAGAEAVMVLSEVSGFWEENQEELSETFNPLIEDRVFMQVPRHKQTSLFVSDEEVTQFTYDTTALGKSNLEDTYLIYDFVTNEINYLVYDDWRNAKEVLHSRSGDCTDKSVLMVSMLESVGIEAYVVYGTGDYELTSHAWVAARIDDTWLYLDPTVNDFYYVYKTLENNTEFYRYYDPIAGMFNSNTALEIRA
jgi:transglutaminase-like putative cysteine protease